MTALVMKDHRLVNDVNYPVKAPSALVTLLDALRTRGASVRIDYKQPPKRSKTPARLPVEGVLVANVSMIPRLHIRDAARRLVLADELLIERIVEIDGVQVFPQPLQAAA